MHTQLLPLLQPELHSQLSPLLPLLLSFLQSELPAFRLLPVAGLLPNLSAISGLPTVVGRLPAVVGHLPAVVRRLPANLAPQTFQQQAHTKEAWISPCLFYYLKVYQPRSKNGLLPVTLSGRP